ncbi:hypothetical protein [Thiobacillus sp.]|uniref:hypothetical protein n=1 Tax=Thiobacillus sp. TaxID=924 RepID=UPI0025CEF020|nr:hypothetical protein [Thiobacillus sp.]
MKLWRDQPNNWNWKPSVKEMTFIWLGFGGVFYLLAFSAYSSPSQSSRTGRWGWLHEIFFNAFGANGDIVLYSAAGTACVVASIFVYRKA